MAARIYGIDLGTTFSALAYVDDHGQPVVIPNAEGERITPSVVVFERSSPLVGTPAVQRATLIPRQTVELIKRSMGDLNYAFEEGGRIYRPEEISSLILRKLVRDAEQKLRTRITDVVITCPAYFGTAQREATARAGEIAGLNVHAILDEPTAAALTYGVGRPVKEVALVYDLGGGTFDVTVITIDRGDVTVLCKGGDPMLGGRDWDDALVIHAAKEFRRQTGESRDPLQDPGVLKNLEHQVEKAKRWLSVEPRVHLSIDAFEQRVTVEITRDLFEQLTGGLLTRTLELTRGMFFEAWGRGAERIDRILLVGGATRMPQVFHRLTQEFPEIAVESHDPDEAVAKGAALYAHRLATRGQDAPRITNVASKTFGVVIMGGEGKLQVLNLIQKNTSLPVRVTHAFSTAHPGQRELLLRVMESNSLEQVSSLTLCSEVGRALFPLPPGLPQHFRLEIEFHLNEQARLEVQARDPTTGRWHVVPVRAGRTVVVEAVEDRPNYFQLLGLDLADATPDHIENVLGVWQREWSARSNHPTEKFQARRNLELLEDIRRVMLDPDLRQAEATRYAQDRRKYVDDARQELLETLNRASPLATNLLGMIGKLEQQFKGRLTRREIEGCLHEWARSDSSLGSSMGALLAGLERCLRVVGKPDLYTFLGCSRQASSGDLIHTAKQMDQGLRQENRRSARQHAEADLVGHALFLFSDPSWRARYDDVLLQREHDQQVADFRQLVDLACAGGMLRRHARDKLLVEARQRGLKEELVWQIIEGVRRRGCIVESDVPRPREDLLRVRWRLHYWRRFWLFGARRAEVVAVTEGARERLRRLCLVGRINEFPATPLDGQLLAEWVASGPTPREIALRVTPGRTRRGEIFCRLFAEPTNEVETVGPSGGDAILRL